MRTAVAATHHGFEAVIAELREAVAKGRGERWVEGVFGLHARHQGNGVGYDSICAAGDHATTLHWIKNTGERARGRPPAPRRRRRGRLALHRRHHPHAARRAAPSPTRSARSTTPCTPRRRPAIAAVKPGNKFSRRARRRHPGDRRAPARVGAAARGRSRRGHPRQGARPVPPPLDGARHQPPPRPRRARLRPGHPRGVHGRRARAGHGAHRRARASTSRPTTC